MNTACPNCGCSESLEALAAKIQRLKDVKQQRAREAEEAKRRSLVSGQPMNFIGGAGISIGTSTGAGGSVVINGGRSGAALGDICAGDGSNHLSSGYPDIDAETLLKGRLTCVECGTWYDPKCQERAEQKRAEIDALTNEIYSAVERLGKLGSDE